MFLGTKEGIVKNVMGEGAIKNPLRFGMENLR